MKRFALLVLCLLMFAAGARAEEGQIRIRGLIPPPAPESCAPSLAEGVHPRTYLNPCVYDDFLSTISSGAGVNYTQFQGMLTEINNFSSLFTSCDRQFKCPQWAFAAAVAYYTYDDIQGYGFNFNGNDKAAYLALVKFALDRGAGATPTNYGSWGYAAALDLVWDGLTGAEKTTYSTWLITVEDVSNKCYQPGSLLNTGLNNSQVFVCWASMQAVAIVLLNETSYQGSWAATNYANFDAAFGDTSTSVMKFEYYYAYSDNTCGGEPSEGIAYGWGYDAEHGIPALEMRRLATGASKQTFWGASHMKMFECWTNGFANLTQLWDEGTTVHRFWSTYRMGPGYTLTDPSFVLTARAMQWAYSYDTTIAGVAKWLEQNRTGALPTSGSAALSHGAVYMMMTPAVAPTSVSPVTAGYPLATYAGKNYVMIRESWTDPHAATVYINARKWQAGNDIKQRCPGGVYLSKDGFMSVATGGWSNANSVETWYGWGNCLAFPDRSVDEPRGYYDNQGTARQTTGNFYTVNFTDTGTFDQLDEVRTSFATGSRVTHYVGLDLNRSYDSDNTPDATSGGTLNPTRISSYFRDVGVAILADRTVVVEHDRAITKSTNFHHTYMVRFPFDVTVDGSGSAGPDRTPTSCESWIPGTGLIQCPTSTHGYTTYTGATKACGSATTNGADGKMCARFLLPSSKTIILAGGPDEDANYWDVTSGYSMEGVDLYGNRFYINGAGFPSGAGATAVDKHYASRYRIEETCSTPSTTCVFLTVKELMASTGTESTIAAWTGGTGYRCAAITPPSGTKVVFCYGTDGWSKTSGSAIFETAGTYNVQWCSANPSANHSFSKGANITSITRVADNDNDLTNYAFDSAGCDEWVVVVGSSGSAAANTITMTS